MKAFRREERGEKMLTSKRSIFVAVFTLVFIWGSAFSIIDIGLNYSPPIFFSAFRALIGGLGLALLALACGGNIEWRRHWRAFLVSALFNVLLFGGLQVFAVFYLPSGLAAILVYLQPIFVGLLAWVWLEEPLGLIKTTGLVLGFLGVLVVSVEGLAGTLSVTGVVVGIFSALFWAIGTICFKRVEGQVSLLWFLTISFLVGGLVFMLLGFFLESWSTITWVVPLWFSLLYTSVIGVTLAWVLWLGLIRAGEAGRVSSYVFFVPLISVGIGTVFLQETFHLSLLAGCGLIVLGIYLVNRRSSPVRDTAGTYTRGSEEVSHEVGRTGRGDSTDGN
jgi:drug/metabolite transporter (DMT)-like permease